MNNSKPKGIKRILNACHYSWQGIRSCFATEAAFRQEVVLATIALPLACWLEVTAAERALMMGSVLLVLVVELLNTAVEAVVDRVSEERHPLSKKAKDAASAAVMLALVNAGVVWGVVLL